MKKFLGFFVVAFGFRLCSSSCAEHNAGLPCEAHRAQRGFRAMRASFILTGLIFSAHLFAADAGSSSGSASISTVQEMLDQLSSSDAGGKTITYKDKSYALTKLVILVCGDEKIELTLDQVGKLNSAVINAAISGGMSESKNLVIELPAGFDAKTVKLVIKIVGKFSKIAANSSKDKRTIKNEFKKKLKHIIETDGIERSNLALIVKFLDYLQVEQIITRYTVNFLLENNYFDLNMFLNLTACNAAAVECYFDQGNINYVNSILLHDIVRYKYECELRFGKNARILSVAYSPNGEFLAEGGDDVIIRIWDTKTYSLKQTLAGHTSIVTSLAWSPDSKQMVSRSYDGTIRVWNVEKELCEYVIESNDLVKETTDVSAYPNVVWSPDGVHIASGNFDGTIRIWNVNTGKLEQTLIGHSRAVISVAYSPDGTMLASGSCDNTTRIWNVKTGSSEKIMEHMFGNPPTAPLKYSSDGTKIVAGFGPCIFLWQLESDEEFFVRLGEEKDEEFFVRVGEEKIVSMALSPDSQWIVCSCQNGRYERPIGLLGMVDSNLACRHWHDLSQSYLVYAVDFSPDGKHIAVGCYVDEKGKRGAHLHIWDCAMLTPLQRLFLFALRQPTQSEFELTAWPSACIDKLFALYQSLQNLQTDDYCYCDIVRQIDKAYRERVQSKIDKLVEQLCVIPVTKTHSATEKKSTKSFAATTPKSFGESVFRKVGLLMLQHKPAKEVLSFFDAHKEEFGDRAQEVQKNIARYTEKQEKERGDGASSSSDNK